MKKLSLLLMLIVCTISETMAQDNRVPFNDLDKIPVLKGCEDNENNDEVLACFNSGVISHIAENFKYPDEAKKLEVQAKIYVTFIITADNKISSVEILRGAESTVNGNEEVRKAARMLDEEAKRVISTLQIAAPGYKDGKAVEVQYTIPIVAKV